MAPKLKILYLCTGNSCRSQMVVQAAKGANLEEQRNCYRLVRDEIRAFVETLPDSLNRQENSE